MTTPDERSGAELDRSHILELIEHRGHVLAKDGRGTPSRVIAFCAEPSVVIENDGTREHLALSVLQRDYEPWTPSEYAVRLAEQFANRWELGEAGIRAIAEAVTQAEHDLY